MIKQKKRQIVNAEKAVLQHQLENENEEHKPEDFNISKKEPAKVTSEEALALERKKKIAEAVKAVIKTSKEEQMILDEKRVSYKKTINYREKKWKN